MSDDPGNIIIKGGSVDLDYDDTIYVKESGNPKIHKNENRNITRILVLDEKKAPVYDSEQHNEGLRWTVTVYTK
jgi:hypothetical protein